MIEAAPRRAPFPRLTQPSTTRPATPPSATRPSSGSASNSRPSAPSARIDASRSRGSSRTSAPSARTDRDIDRDGGAASLPLAPTRSIDRDKILERYGRAGSSGDSSRATPTERGPSSRTAPRETNSKGASGPSSSAKDSSRSERGDSSRAREPKSSSKGVSPESVRKARDDYRAKQGSKIAEQRSELTAKRNDSITSNRDSYRTQQSASEQKRQAAVIAKQTQRLRDLDARDPTTARIVRNQGERIASATNIAIGLSFSACSPWGWYLGWGSPWWACNSWGYYGGYWGANYGYWWNCGTYPYSWYCHPFAWSYYSSYRCWPYGISTWWPSSYSYGYSQPVYYSTILVDRYYDDDPVRTEVVYVDSTPEPSVPAQVGESVEYSAPVASVPSSSGATFERGPSSSARATTQYLSLGDTAFREGRYADAVHFYAKAVEFSPQDGVLYLVLSDALLATGDYHYGAFALRRALELDATLADQPLDKHDFYADPSEFDQQLQTLERYLADRSGDADARLLLAANYLFSGRAAYANDLLEAGASASVREEPAGKLILAAAKRVLDAKK